MYNLLNGLFGFAELIFLSVVAVVLAAQGLYLAGVLVLGGLLRALGALNIKRG